MFTILTYVSNFTSTRNINFSTPAIQNRWAYNFPVLHLDGIYNSRINVISLRRKYFHNQYSNNNNFYTVYGEKFYRFYYGIRKYCFENYDIAIYITYWMLYFSNLWKSVHNINIHSWLWCLLFYIRSYFFKFYLKV